MNNIKEMLVLRLKTNSHRSHDAGNSKARKMKSMETNYLHTERQTEGPTIKTHAIFLGYHTVEVYQFYF